jgi:hypothetical protein
MEEGRWMEEEEEERRKKGRRREEEGDKGRSAEKRSAVAGESEGSAPPRVFPPAFGGAGL